MRIAADRAWAREEFGDAALGSKRRTDRLIAMAAGVASAPDGRITSVFCDGASREGSFRFVENGHIHPRAIAEAPYRAAARRASAYSYVFVPVDGTSLNIIDRKRTKGLGLIGSRGFGVTGMQVMSAIAVAPDGAPLGLCDIRFWTRLRRSPRCGRHDKRDVRQKETAHWLDAVGSVHQNFVAHAPNCTPWFQLDRGADARPVLELCLARGLTATVRASWNRSLWKGGAAPDRYLWEYLDRKRIQGTTSIEVPPRNGQPRRVANLSIRFAEVVLDLHNDHRRHRRPGRFSAVLVRETGVVPCGQARIEWLLLTTYTVEDLDDALAVIDGYATRWTIEEFHRTWKSGACDVETTQLRAVDHIERWATILAAVAIRIVRLAKLARTEPELPATVELKQSEIDAIILTKKRTKYSPGQTPTIGEAVTWLAEIGGYTGKSSGGPPGPQVISRGMLRLQALADYLERQGEK